MIPKSPPAPVLRLSAAALAASWIVDPADIEPDKFGFGLSGFPISGASSLARGLWVVLSSFFPGSWGIGVAFAISEEVFAGGLRLISGIASGPGAPGLVALETISRGLGAS